MQLNVLSISDQMVDVVYSPRLGERFADVDLVLSCGDLPYYYVEYVVTGLTAPVFFVRGNHAARIETTCGAPFTGPRGAVDLHRRVLSWRGLLLAGVEGSVRYKPGPFQYSQRQMWGHVLSLVPRLMWNRARHGRFLDAFVSHAPPWGIHDRPDLPHHGIRAFRWLLATFQPRYHFHGHIHLYSPKEPTESRFGRTQVINTYGYRRTTLDIPEL